MRDAGIERARALLAAHPVADGHNDLPWALRNLSGSSTEIDINLLEEQPKLHTDLVRLRQGGVGLQFWSVYVPCRLAGHSAVTAVLEQIELVYRLAARYPAQLRIVGTAEEAEAAIADGRIASMLGAEGGHCLADSIGVLRALHRLGVRYLTLTHNENVSWADSATDEPAAGGLTDLGREIVAEMNRLGMLVDLSHVAATTMRDALDTTIAPVIFSHSSCRAVVDYPRNVPDEILERLPANGGVCMVTFVPGFVSPAVSAWRYELQEAMKAAGGNPNDRAERERFAATWPGRDRKPVATLDDVIAHVEHAREVAGIDHVGLGGDFDGVDALPAELADVSRYPVLFAALLDRGWSDSDCAKLASGNILRVLRAAEDVARVG
jgi:membrane dipeptidase